MLICQLGFTLDTSISQPSLPVDGGCFSVGCPVPCAMPGCLPTTVSAACRNCVSLLTVSGCLPVVTAICLSYVSPFALVVSSVFCPVRHWSLSSARFVRARVCRSVTVVMSCCCSLFVQVSVFRLAGVYLRRRVSLSCVTVLMLSLATAPARRACSPATPDDFF